MPITYTNRKGTTYTLCMGKTKTGKPRYFFSREPKDEVLDQLPAGYKITESINGIVSCTSDRPGKILADELVVVEQILSHHPSAAQYRLNVRPDRIEVHEATIQDIADVFGSLTGRGDGFPDFSPAVVQRFRERQIRKAQYSPVMQFILVDDVQRLFGAQRWCYRSSVDGWLRVDHADKLAALAARLIPRLGTETFFDLF